MVLVTKKGVIKKTTLEAYSRPRANGIIAVGIREGDAVIYRSGVVSDGDGVPTRRDHQPDNPRRN